MPSLQSNEEETRSRVLEQAPVLPGFPEITSKLLPLAQARDLYHKARHETDGFQLERLLAEMRIELRVDAADLSRIPTTGPVVAVSNHPFGILDGVVLAVLLSRVRPDVKILTNSLLAGVKDLERTCIFVDPFGAAASAEINRRALRQSMAWLTQRGMLAIFPAGEVSHWRLPEGEIVDPRWKETAARLIRKLGAAALPVYFCGQNSLAFQLLGMIHPRLRTVFLLQEFLQQTGKRVEVRIGSAIPAESVSSLPNDREASEYLRWRTYLLAERGRPRGQLPALVRAVLPRMPQQAIAGGQTRELLISEIRALPAERRLAENAEFSVFAAQSQEIPHLLQEIGRLREITFRAVGEGTGRSTDLDHFDQYYWHFFLWSKTTRELAGAYRAGQTDQILAAHGVSGLYTGTLFRFDQRLFQKLGPALELGRSFICLEYQRQYAPLLLLWKGIARFVAARPQTPILFGAVSISSAYSHASRELMVRFFESRAIAPDGITDGARV